MKILAIETSCDIASVSLFNDNNLILELKETSVKNHSEALMPLIDRLLKETSTTLDDIDLFACDNGPGSFTGIRIGLSTVKAFCDVKTKSCIAVSSLEALAYTCRQENSYICAMIDAKHLNLYYGIFEYKNGKYTKVTDFAFSSFDNFLQKIISLKKNIFFVGNCGILYKDTIKSSLENDVTFLDDTLVFSKEVGLVAYDKFQAGELTTSRELSALYLKKSNAESN